MKLIVLAASFTLLSPIAFAEAPPASGSAYTCHARGINPLRPNWSNFQASAGNRQTAADLALRECASHVPHLMLCQLAGCSVFIHH